VGSRTVVRGLVLLVGVMKAKAPLCSVAAADPTLQVYLLGSVDFEAALALQRRLVFDVAGNRSTAALILCEHPPLITVGRQGSWAHILCDRDELRARGWRVRWVNRGGGCVLHTPGQMAIYPVLALDRFGLGVQDYLDRLQAVAIALLDEFGIQGETHPGQPGVWVARRPIAGVGVAIRDWVTYYGAFLNVNPDLQPFRFVQMAGSAGRTVTSIERERHGPLRSAFARERLVEQFSDRFHFARTSLFFDHPLLERKAPSDALATSS
jgi:lipoyl(octanoyl) transferase